MPGHMEHARQSYRDDLIRPFVDVDDIAENHQFFLARKDRLKIKFAQFDIRITTYLIEVYSTAKSLGGKPRFVCGCDCS